MIGLRRMDQILIIANPRQHYKFLRKKEQTLKAP